MSRLANILKLVKPPTSRTFAVSSAARNTAAQVERTREVGAAAETQDVKTVDALLRVTRMSSLCFIVCALTSSSC